jgi:peptide/nickel transport system permease protein
VSGSSVPDGSAVARVPLVAAESPPGGEPMAPSFRRPRATLFERVASVGANAGLAVGIALLALYVLVAVVALARFGRRLNTLSSNPAWAYAFVAPGPSARHPFGTMRGLGVDVLQAIVQATPWDLALVGGILVASASIGLFLGARAGADRRGNLDAAITAWSDIVAGVPPFFLALVLFLGLQPFLSPADYLPIFGVVFVFVLWPYYARTVRIRARQVADETFVEAARASGAGSWRILRRHVLPNSLFPLFAQVPIDVYNIFFVLSAFPFFACFTGLGSSGHSLVPVSQSPLPGPLFPEWGNLLAQGACWGWSILPSLNQWWSYAFPAAAIFGFGLAVTLLCDGLLRTREREYRP